MDLTSAGSNIALLLAALLAAGFVMGFVAGLFGAGGGAIAAPALYEAFRLFGVDSEVRMHLAIGTALAVMIPTTLRSFQTHRAHDGVDMTALPRLGVGVVAGVALGSVIASSVTGDTLKWIWVAFATVMALKLWFGRASWKLADTLPPRPFLEIWGVLTGILSTLLSIGGGAFITLAMMLYGRPIQVAIGTASGIGPLIAIPGTLGFIWAGWGEAGLPPLSLGFVSPIGAAMLIPTSVLAAPLGARLAHGIPRRWLEIAMGALLASIGLRFLVSLFT